MEPLVIDEGNMLPRKEEKRLLTIVHNGRDGAHARMIKVYDDGTTKVMTIREYLTDMRETFKCLKGMEF